MMKLGEALTVRRRQADKMNDLRNRIKANVLIQEGDAPQEDAMKLLDEYKELSLQHAELVRRINRTNIATTVAQTGPLANLTLAELLADREHMLRVRSSVALAADSASPNRSEYRYMRSEIRLVSLVNITTLRGTIDELSEAINEYDLQIQETNWQTDLL